MNNFFSEKYTLSLAQQDVFYDQLHAINSPKYNIGGYVNMKKIDEEKVRVAHAMVLNNNRMFRLRLVSQENGVFVTLSDDVNTFLEILDLSEEFDPYFFATKWMTEIFAKSFDLFGDSLFKAFLLKVSSDEYFYVGIAHHLIIDGWGFSNWARKLGYYYSGYNQKPESEDDFQTYYMQDISYLESERYKRDRVFWGDYLKNTTTKTLLSQYSVADTEPCSQRLCFDINADLYNAVLASSKVFKQNEHCLFFALVVAYFCRVSQLNAITIGVPTHNRKGAAQKDFIGLFMGMSPVKIDIRDSRTFIDLLENIKKEQVKVYRHQKYPIGHMVHDLGSSARAGLFDIGFNFLKLDNQFSFGNTSATIHYVENKYQTTPFNLTVWSNGINEPLQLQIDFKLQYFKAGDIQLIGARLQNLLFQVADNPHILLASLDIISKEEQDLIWCSPQKSETLDLEKPFIHYFEQQVNQQPDKLALSWKNQEFSYKQLNYQAAKLAKKLAENGVASGHLVGLLLDRRPEMLIAILALYKLDAAYLPLDPSYPGGRLKFMVEDSQCKLLLTTTDLDHLSQTLAVSTLNIERRVDETIEQESLYLHNYASSTGQMAYVIYTSGSTGRPKGVMVSQRALSNFLQSMQIKPGFGGDDCLLAITPFSFDISILELLLPLISGGCVHLFHTALTQDVQGLIRDLAKRNVSMLQMTPSAWKILLAAGWLGDAKLKALTGGEALPRYLAENLAPKCKELWNMYGPTETTIWSSCTHVKLPLETNSIGQPIENTQMLILDEHQRPLPPGVFGMLYIGGQGLADGYLYRPELTNERFTILFGQRWYQTGDIARLLPNGEFEFQGRSDHQIKMNGYRIELSEIESVLSRQSGVIDCAVLIKTMNSGRQIICAYYQCNDDLREHDLKRALAEDLPVYMLPSVLIKIEEFPRTPSGKTELKSLPEPDFQESSPIQSAHAYDELTVALLSIVKSHLHIPSLMPHENFFDIGASSIDITDITSKLNQELGLNLSVIDMFTNPSIQSLIKFLEKKSSAHSDTRKVNRQEAAQHGKSRLNNRLNARKLLNEA